MARDEDRVLAEAVENVGDRGVPGGRRLPARDTKQRDQEEEK